jgi:hypothetical protein
MKTIKNILPVIALILTMGSCRQSNEPIKYRAFNTSSGWGYEIMINKKIFIRQEHIPVIAAIKGFDTKEQAADAARMVIAKIRNRQIPTLTENDLRRLNVIR